MSEHKCELCGTPVKVVGKTTKHYEPLVSVASVPKIKWPEKKYREHNQHLTSGDWYACNDCGSMGDCKCAEIYNAAIDTCRRAYEENGWNQ